MNIFLIILIIAGFILLNKNYLPKIKINKEFNNFVGTIKKLKNKNQDYTKILDDISFQGFILIIGLLLIMVPWTLIFLISEYLGMNRFIAFIFATIPYITIIKFRN